MTEEEASEVRIARQEVLVAQIADLASAWLAEAASAGEPEREPVEIVKVMIAGAASAAAIMSVDGAEDQCAITAHLMFAAALKSSMDAKKAAVARRAAAASN